MRRCFFHAPLLVLCIAAPALAETAPRQDPDDAVFTATEVVIVAPDKPHTFRVERSYRGDLAIGSKIDLPTFELESWGMWQNRQSETMTADTRILMFLRPDAKNPAAHEITDWGDAFFFRDVAQVDELDEMAKHALGRHKKWQDARDLVDPAERIRALLSFLLDIEPKRKQQLAACEHFQAARDPREPGNHIRALPPRFFDPVNSCERLTREELAKLTPAPADYVASLLAGPTPRDCLLVGVCGLRSPKSHAAMIAAVDVARQRVEKYLAARELKVPDAKANWSDVAEEVIDNYSIIYYGLHALASFRDPADMPYLRSLVPFLLASDCQQALRECILAMVDNPSPENTAVLISIWEDCKAHPERLTRKETLPVSVAWAMTYQNDAVALPSLLEIIDDPRWQHKLFGLLHPRAGKEFRSPAECRAWCVALLTPAAKTRSAVPNPTGGSRGRTPLPEIDYR